MAAYYNEHDKAKAAWLREAIVQGVIAYGEVDERSIEDVAPADLEGFTQCHFFAGIGGWSIALRLAGWLDEWGIWTASLPCQPFSAAGKGAGFADERHLWPAFFHLFSHGKPEAVPAFGEQVASSDGLTWLDVVSADMERAGHTVGTVDSCSAGFGAPHIRQRLYWVADAKGRGQSDGGVGDEAGSQRSPLGGGPEQHEGCRRDDLADGSRPMRGLANSDRLQPEQPAGNRARPRETEGRGALGKLAGYGNAVHPRPNGGHWRAAGWLFCRDGFWRPAEPGTFPLAYGLPRSLGRLQPELQRLAEMAGLDAKSLARAKNNRIVRLQGYGDAINVIQAAEFVRAYMEERALPLLAGEGA